MFVLKTPNPKYKTDCNPQLGFSVVEVLVAFTVLALSLGALTQLYSGGFKNLALADQSYSAVRLAKNLLAEVGITKPLSVGETTGTTNGGLHWKIFISPFFNGASNKNASRVSTFDVLVTVSWGPGSRKKARSLSLQTIKTQMSHQ